MGRLYPITLFFQVTLVVTALLVSGVNSVCLQCDGGCAQQKIDLTFVLDGSGSICAGKPRWDCAEWTAVLDFVNRIVDNLDIRSDGDRVAVVQFGNEATKEFGLTTYSNPIALKAAISLLQLKDENTNTSGGLKVMRTQVFNTPEDRTGVANAAIVITDGKSTRDPDRTLPEARLVEADGTRAYVIGVTSSVDAAEVEGISGVPRQENVTYWFLRDFTFFDSLRVTRQVFDTFCKPASAFTTTPSSVPVCPGTQTIAGCYIVKETPRDWKTADADCQSEAVFLQRPGMGHLASVPDTTHNDLLIQTLKQLVASKQTFEEQDALNKFWMGGYEESLTFNMQRNPVWRWVEGMKRVSHQGCFKDSPSYPEFPVHKIDAALTLANCTEYCRTRGYSVLALQAGNKCGCGNSFGAYEATEGCTTFCGGDTSQMCGGTLLNDIYLIDGAFNVWGSDQPNNFNKYQPCGKLNKVTASNQWATADTTCYDQLTYMCDIPVSFCATKPPNHYTVNGRCVFIEMLTTRSWFTAREDCKQRYGDLLTIDSQATLSALIELLNNKLFSAAPYWVGLVGRQWLWQNGQEFLYTSWLTSEPNEISKNCLMMESNAQTVYGWNEEDCALNLPYVCYIDFDTRLTTQSVNTTIGNTTAYPTTPEMTVEDTTPSPTTTTAIPLPLDPDLGASTGGTGGLSVFWIVVIILAVLLVIIVIVVLCYCCCCKKDDDRDKKSIYPADAPVREGTVYDNHGFYRPPTDDTSLQTQTTLVDPEKSSRRVRISTSDEYEVPVSHQITSNAGYFPKASIRSQVTEQRYSVSEQEQEPKLTWEESEKRRRRAERKVIKETERRKAEEKEREEQERRGREERERREEEERLRRKEERREERKEKRRQERSMERREDRTVDRSMERRQKKDRSSRKDISGSEVVRYVKPSVKYNRGNSFGTTDFAGESYTVDMDDQKLV